MRDWHFSLWVTSNAKRGKHVDSLDWLDLNHFRGKFPFLEHLWEHLFCFSFPVEECLLALCWTRAQIKIYIFISSRLVSLIFGPSCCCYSFPCTFRNFHENKQEGFFSIPRSCCSKLLIKISKGGYFAPLSLLNGYQNWSEFHSYWVPCTCDFVPNMFKTRRLKRK